MKSFSELDSNQKCIELLRWSGVLPEALLSGVVASSVAVQLLYLAAAGRLIASLATQFSMGATFVIVGALTAPRLRSATAIAMSILWSILAGISHVVLPESPGFWNWIDASMAAAAGAGSAITICCRESRKSPAQLD
ncbi:MAG: hypothetical protein O3B86_09090 [Planctomycetota bacterium]|nr:hypothetical protein [Planctomycetota bacterium]